MENLIKYILTQFEDEMSGELIRILMNYIDTKEIKTENQQAHIVFNIVVKKKADKLISQRERKRKQRTKGANKNGK